MRGRWKSNVVSHHVATSSYDVGGNFDGLVGVENLYYFPVLCAFLVRFLAHLATHCLVPISRLLLNTPVQCRKIVRDYSAHSRILWCSPKPIFDL